MAPHVVTQTDVRRICAEYKLCLHGHRPACRTCNRAHSKADVTLSAVEAVAKLAGRYIHADGVHVDQKYDTMNKFSILRREGPLANWANVHGAFVAYLILNGFVVQQAQRTSLAYLTNAWVSVEHPPPTTPELDDDAPKEEEEDDAPEDDAQEVVPPQPPQQPPAETVVAQETVFMVPPVYYLKGVPSVHTELLIECGPYVYACRAIKFQDIS